MENDITELLKRRTYLFLTIFLFVVTCLSFFLLYGMRQSDHFTISNARLVYEQSILQAANPMIVQEIHTEEGASIVRGALLVTVQNVCSDEELAHLKKNVELAQKNIEQIQYGTVAAQNIPVPTEALESARVRMERMNELYESRPYFPGDDPRKIHWKLYAHTNTLSIKLGAFEPPPVKRLTIYIEEPVCMKKKERAWVASIFDAFIGRLSGVIIELLNAGIQCSLLLYDYPQQSLQRYEITEEASAAAAQIQNLLAIPALRASPEALPDAAEVFNAVPDGGGLLYCYMPTGGVSRNAAGVSFRPSRTEDITGVETFFCLAAPPVSEEHTPLDERAHRVLSRRGIHRLLYSSAASARQDAFYRKVQEAAERELRIFTAGNCHAELL